MPLDRSRRDRTAAELIASLTKSLRHKRQKRCLCLVGIIAFRGNVNGRAFRSRQHHQAHDRITGDRCSATGNLDYTSEPARRLRECRGGTRVQAFAVDDFNSGSRHEPKPCCLFHIAQQL